ncbi:MAG: VWA domain-containing protein, partial [Planctomycetota bacterium]|nr:VWA domain-containing protein [Planctomycetota bacterium]
ALAGGSVGDVNGDGRSDTILDGELAGYLALTQDLIDRRLGDRARVGITVFGSSATSLDMDPETAGVQIFTTPLADSDNDGVRDLQAILQSIVVAHGGVGQSTNFEAALREAQSQLGSASAGDEGNVLFLSDGEQNAGGSYDDEVAALRSEGTHIRAFGVGTGSSLPDLQIIDPDTTIFTTTDELLNVFRGLSSGQVHFTEPVLSGWTLYLDANRNGVYDEGEPTTVTDEQGAYAFTGLAAGTYAVGEVQQTGWRQTYPLDSDATAPQLYVHDDRGRLATVDVANGTVDVIGAMGVILTDIAFDPQGDLYGISFTDLYRIDAGSAVTTKIGPHGIPGGNALVFKTDGTLYGAGFASTNLYEINPANGATTLLGDMGFASAGDLAFHQGSLYLTSSTNELILIDPSGAVSGTLVGDLGFPFAYGLATADDGILYALSDTRVLAVNATTGAATVATTFGGQDFSVSYGSSFRTEAGASKFGVHTLVLGPGEVAEMIDFGNRQELGTLSGVKWDDLNRDGIRDVGEPLLEGWTIYLDVDDDGVFDSNEPVTVTGSDGGYEFRDIQAGTWSIREVNQPGWTQTFPANGDATQVFDVNFNADVPGAITVGSNSNPIPLEQPTLQIIDAASSAEIVTSAANMFGQPALLSGIKGGNSRGLSTIEFANPTEIVSEFSTVRWTSAVTTLPPDDSSIFTGISIVDDISNSRRAALTVGYSSSGQFEFTDADGTHTAGLFRVNEADRFELRMDHNAGLYHVYENGILITHGRLAEEGDFYSAVFTSRTFVDTAAASLVVDDISVQTSSFSHHAGSHTVTLGAGQTISGLDFGNARPPGEIRGAKWNDINANGVRDTNLISGEDPDVVFVVDVSGSTRREFSGGAVGDLNNDGDSNTILDGEIAGFQALNRVLIDHGFGHTARVGVVVFGSSAKALD